MFPTSTLRRRATLTLFIASGALAASAQGQFTIDPAVNYLVGTQPSGMTSGDFNGDGFRDLATTTDGPDKISILLNTGTGTFIPGPIVLIGSSSSPQDVIAGDLDGDGDMDLAVAVRDPQGAVVIFKNTGGAFSAAGTFVVGERPRGLSIGDIEGDGDLDLAVANRNGNSASVLTNDGTGAFTVQTVAVGGEARATALLNIDGDGDLDLAVTDHDNRAVDLFTNTAGAFAPSGSLSVGPFVRPDGIAAADLDGDGSADLAAAVSDQTLGINEVRVFLATGAGGFAPGVGYPTGGVNTSHVTAADLDCDGLIDLAASNADSANISILPNTGGGAFGAAMIRASGATPERITSADLDGDGDADIAVANRDSSSVSVFINGTCTGVPGDVNGDGIVDFDDLLTLLSTWGPCPGCPADLDGDGMVGFDDLLILLSNWS